MQLVLPQQVNNNQSQRSKQNHTKQHNQNIHILHQKACGNDKNIDNKNDEHRLRVGKAGIKEVIMQVGSVGPER